jgi:imidazolonepropionase-like amidohydrolase
MLDRPTVAALVEAAHRRGKLAVAHIGSEQQARDVISAGVDGLAHLFVGETASLDFGRFAAEHHIFVIPTLTILYPSCGMGDGANILKNEALAKSIDAHFRETLLWTSEAKTSCEGTKQALRQLHEAAVPILAGTDAPGAGTTYGASLHWELEHLVDLGLSPAEALAAATSVPAAKFGMNDRGRIAPGMRADLLFVDGDVSKDITDTRKIVGIWKRGVRFE